MRCAVLSLIALATVASSMSARPAAALAADAPADRVVVMYFHRTQRCPTCQKMGSYAEEAVKEGFPKEVDEGKVELHFINFEDEKNDAITKAYKIKGPALIVARIAGSKVAEHKNLKEIWKKVNDKEAFIDYVKGNVKEYLDKIS